MALEPKKDPGFSFPYEANPEFDFDENAQSERLTEIQNTWLKDLQSRFPYSGWFIKLNILEIDSQNIGVNTPLQHAEILSCF